MCTWSELEPNVLLIGTVRGWPGTWNVFNIYLLTEIMIE